MTANLMQMPDYRIGCRLGLCRRVTTTLKQKVASLALSGSPPHYKSRSMSSFLWLLSQASGVLTGGDVLPSLARSNATGGEAVDRHSFDFLRSLESKIRKILILSDQQLCKPHIQADFATDMRDLAEVLVWSDNRNLDDCFALFIEKEIHQVLIDILEYAKDHDAIVLSVLRFFNVFLESVKSGSIMYFMLSNNYINDVISVPLNVENEEILSYFVTLLKNISNKLNSRTIQLLFNENNRTYPLFSQATIYHYHQEAMIRIGVRTIILNLLHVNDPETLSFIIHDKFYFIGVVDHLAEILQSLCSHMEDKSRSDALEQLNLFLEYLEYLNEIFSLELEEANKALAAAFLERIVVSGSSPTEDPTSSPPLITPVISYPSFLMPDLYINSHGSSRQLIMASLSPKANGRHMMLTLALLYTVITSDVSSIVLDASNILPAKLRKTKLLLSSLVEPEDQPQDVDSDTSRLKTHHANEETQSLNNFDLVYRLLAILSADEIFTFPQLTSQLIFHLLVELIGVLGKSGDLPPDADALIKTSFTLCTTRFKTALDIDEASCMEIFDFEIRQGPPNLHNAISSCQCLIPPQNHARSSEALTDLIPLSIAVKTWLLYYDCLCKIGMRRSILSPPFNWSSPPLLPHWDDCNIIPCVVQVTEQGRTHPPENRYFVECDTHLVLAEPLSRKSQQQRATTDPATVCQYMRWPRIKTVLVGADLYAVDILELRPIFSETHTQNIMVDLDGYNIISGSETTWRGRLVFGTNEAQEHVRDFIAQRQTASILAWKRNVEHVLEQLRWRYI
ncbi:hypothetical protein BASA50_010849 [Batrachochytrium salamandrivorans]|uniref:FPL domain-containing protein n=1 Tax=Batrachochytrium salamandrivorans TaxID=1357716 RepID=A0ABQ8EXH7_9FUNG|nr:hypothetical protein BASA50_010849 [Batrachochytrium salamandrivorans]